MRKINKCTQPHELSDFIKKKNPTNWDCIHESENQDIYNICKEVLLKEQNCLSGYTERVVKEKDVHVDHFKKKGMFQTTTFDWDNLILDEHNVNYGADYKDNNVKITDYQFLINPKIEDPHEYFTYQIDGKIIPQKDLPDTKRIKAETTIRIFNLNYSKLVNQRNSILNEIGCYVNDMTTDEILSAFENSGFLSVVEFALGCY